MEAENADAQAVQLLCDTSVKGPVRPSSKTWYFMWTNKNPKSVKPVIIIVKYSSFISQESLTKSERYTFLVDGG